MSQTLHLGGGVHAIVDAVFADGGTEAKRAMIAGQIVELAPATPPKPTIARRGKDFFYLTAKMEPVADPKHVEHLAEPHRSEALAFIERTRGAAPKPPLMKGAKRAKAIARRETPPVKGVRIDDERKLAAAAGGGVQVEGG